MNSNPNVVTAEVALEAQFLRATLRLEVESGDHPVLLEEFGADQFFLQVKLPAVLGALAPEMLHRLLQAAAQQLRDAHRHEFALTHGLLKKPAAPADGQPSTEARP